MAASFYFKQSRVGVLATSIGISAMCVLLSGLMVACTNGGGELEESETPPTSERIVEVEVFEVGDELAPEEDEVSPDSPDAVDPINEANGIADVDVDAPPSGRESVASFVAVDEEGNISRAAHVMTVRNPCRSVDPAIDAASGARGLGLFPIINEIHAGLTRLSSDGSGTAEPALAETFTVIDAGTKFEIRLRDGLKFSDGSDITASDVKWSWERALRKSTPWSRGRDVLGSIVGASTVADGVVEELSGVLVVDEQTLIVSLVGPRSHFTYLLADPVASVLKRENVETWHIEWTNDAFPSDLAEAFQGSRTGGASISRGSSFAPFGENMPVGAGPFKLVEYAPIPAGIYSSCAMVRSEHYWDHPAHLDAVRFVPNLSLSVGNGRNSIGDSQQSFISGQIDYVYYGPAGEETGNPLTSDGKFQNVSQPPYTRFLAFNPAMPPFDDLSFRRALIASADLASFWAPYEVTWERTVVPTSLVNSYDGCTSQPMDLELAQAALRDSKYHPVDSETSSAVYWTNIQSPSTDRIVRLLETWKETLNFSVEFKYIEQVSELYGLMHGDGLYIRDVEISPLYPNLHAVFRSMIDAFGDSSESVEWRRVETMVNDASMERDAAERIQRYQDIECHLFERALVLPLAVDKADITIVVQPRVHGFSVPRYNRSAFQSVWFDETAPERAFPD